MITVKSIARHRNGICGAPFFVVLFDWRDAGTVRAMSAVLFDSPGSCAVLDTVETAAGNVEFAGGNSWRGDHFEDELRAAIRTKYEDAA